jgi:nicotinamide phosphoribosyltransferase
MYPEGTDGMFDHFLSRGGRYGMSQWVGMQYILLTSFTERVTKKDVEHAAAWHAKRNEPFNFTGWMRVVEKHNGYLPLVIRAVPEGMLIPVQNILMSVEATDKELFWLASWAETQLTRVWYPMTVSTQGWHIKKNVLEALVASSDDPLAELPYKYHDFGGRGAACAEAAMIGGMAHCVNWHGSDTCEGVELANQCYSTDMAAGSIVASEHSVVGSWGRGGELDFYQHYLDLFAKPGALMACVSDTWDVFNATENYWCGELLEQIKNSGATLVVRPDSGDPITVIMKLLEIFERKVGMKKNMKGFKVLPKFLRMIQGDGVNHEAVRAILHEMLSHGYSASNLAFGSGGANLQKVDRDTMKCAYKCSEITINGAPRKVYKDPVTDPGKRSFKGRLDLVLRDGVFQTVEGNQPDSQLVEVFRDGKVTRLFTFEEIRKNAVQALMGAV